MTATVPTNDDFNAAIALVRADIAAYAARMGFTPPSTVPASPGLTPPPPQAAGMTLDFEELWTAPDIGTSHNRWDMGLWYQGPPAASCFTVANGVLTITSPDASQVDLTTCWRDTTGGRFWGASPCYLETTALTTNWSAFWMMSRNHVQNVPKTLANPKTLCSELDIFEMDSMYPNQMWNTIHYNTAGQGGIPDQYNEGAGPGKLSPYVSPTPLANTWHKYGCLIGVSSATVYLDDVAVKTIPFFPSTQQDMWLSLTAGGGGIVSGTAPAVVKSPVITKFGPVRVWKQ